MIDHNIEEKMSTSVYYIESATDDTVLVGMDVERNGPWVSWFDTVKDRCMQIEAITDKSPEHFVFKRTEQEGGHVYSFVPMNLDIYNSFVKAKLFNAQEFDDEQSMIAAFLEAKNNAW